MILTTTPSIEGKKITEYLGIVTGININKPYKKMSFRESLKAEKYNSNFENQIADSKEKAFQQLQEYALKMKATAIIGITVDVEILSTTSKIMVSVTGTAVKYISL